MTRFLETEGFPSFYRRDLPDLVPAELLSRLDHEERLTLKYLSNICRARNTIPSISRLPEDVLIYIFILEASSWQSPWGRVKLTHVCHSWREICLHNALLWTEIRLWDIEQAVTFLKRSETAPLRVWLHEERVGLPLSTDECVMAIKALEPHADHVSELNVLGVSDMTFATYVFTYPFPRLRKLGLGNVFRPIRDIPHIVNFAHERSQPSLDSLILYNVVDSSARWFIGDSESSHCGTNTPSPPSDHPLLPCIYSSRSYGVVPTLNPSYCSMPAQDCMQQQIPIPNPGVSLNCPN